MSYTQINYAYFYFYFLLSVISQFLVCQFCCFVLIAALTKLYFYFAGLGMSMSMTATLGIVRHYFDKWYRGGAFAAIAV